MHRTHMHQRTGFSLVETNISALLGGLLLIMISSVWTGVGRSLVDTLFQARVVAEASLALEALRRDVSGNVPEDLSGGLSLGRRNGQLNAGGDELLFCYEGAPENGAADWGAPDTVIQYRLVGDQLVRENQTTGVAVVVADGVTDFSIANIADGIRIELTIVQRNFGRTYYIVAPNP